MYYSELTEGQFIRTLFLWTMSKVVCPLCRSRGRKKGYLKLLRCYICKGVGKLYMFVLRSRVHRCLVALMKLQQEFSGSMM